MNYLLGLDLGTTGAKALLVDIDGHVISQGYHEYPCFYPKPAWVEQDVDLVIERSMEAAKDALACSGIDPAAILSLSLSSQRCCTIPIGEHSHSVAM